MEETLCTKKDSVVAASSSSTATHDHRKRKKDEDMTEDTEDVPRAKLLLTWTQDEQDVSMTTKLGAGDGEADKVEVTFTEQQMTIKLSDGREQSWCFHGAIDKDQSRVQRKKRKFTIKVVKKEAGMWPDLEATQTPEQQQEVTATQNAASETTNETEPVDSLQEVRTKEEEPVLELQHIKHDFFERDETLTVHMYVKNVSKDAVKIHFDKQSFTVKFQTSDAKFLQLHEGTSEDTVFCWKVNTKNAINPAGCKYKTTTPFIELTLKKASTVRWAGLEALSKKAMKLSLKASFRRERFLERCRQAGSFWAAGGKQKKVLGPYERINTFYGATLCDSKVVASETLTLEADHKDETESPGEQLSSPFPSTSTSCSYSQLPVPATTTSCSARVLGYRSGKGKQPPADQTCSEFQAALTSYINQLQEAKGHRNPELNFAMALADDLVKIKNLKRLCLVKNRIQNLVHDALMEEMPDDD